MYSDYDMSYGYCSGCGLPHEECTCRGNWITATENGEEKKYFENFMGYLFPESYFRENKDEHIRVIWTDASSPFRVGLVYIVEETDDDSMYHVVEGDCDYINKESVKPISKEEYDFIRGLHDEILTKSENFSENLKEFAEYYYDKRNSIKEAE